MSEKCTPEGEQDLRDDNGQPPMVRSFHEPGLLTVNVHAVPQRNVELPVAVSARDRGVYTLNTISARMVARSGLILSQLEWSDSGREIQMMGPEFGPWNSR